MKNTQIQVLTACLIAAATVILSGCASDKGSSAAQETPKAKGTYKGRQYVSNPPTVKFGEFKFVEVKETQIAGKYDNEGNRKTAKKIDQMLVSGLKGMWPDLKVIPAGGEFSKSDQRTLQIAPRIEDIRLVSVGARVMIGVMAGGSDLVMHVDYRDSSNGEIVANPDFWKGNNAWNGGTSWGQADNQIRDAIVSQILLYTAGNK